MRTSSLIRQLTDQPLIRDLSIDAAQAVLALRYCILCRRGERDPFAVAPPCCPRVSFDEALLATMVSAASRHDRAGFDRMSAEMLGSDAREMIFTALENFLRARAPGRV
jgi:hypothetical protein